VVNDIREIAVAKWKTPDISSYRCDTLMSVTHFTFHYYQLYYNSSVKVCDALVQDHIRICLSGTQ